MNFLVNAVQKAHGPKTSLIAQLIDNLDRKYPARDHAMVHASDLTREHFCPREVALLDLTKGQRQPKRIATALKVTFDVGNAIGSMVRERWLVNQVVGDWQCLRCLSKREFCKIPPAVDSASSCAHIWEYKEVMFAALGFTGSIDLFVDLGAPKLTLVEMKIMAPDEWNPLAAPLAEHRVRTNLYMRLIEESSHPARSLINLQSARLLYLSRAFGKKHVEYDEILPFKEYLVARDDSCLVTPLAKASKIDLFRKTGSIPERTCDTSWGPVAKGCSVCGPCFSGKFSP